MGQRGFGDEEQAALARARDRIVDKYLGTDPNVVGVGLGCRTRGGVWTDEPVVVVDVVEKLPCERVEQGRLLPRSVEIDGREWGVDVVETGRIVLL
ncbi:MULTISPECIES: hypothetical protein [Actinomadura]|uniref:Uncharacterized protein n=1 Tax=Actinomadura yumaensis TaxID=111807 RepID=A0ABW2CLL6_9ACTN|nr:hypothetical protein [Actinomadura sp. J1-007]MWK36518.1 hypothetical protein [Actinomadura sp. J1-007]